MPQFARTGPVSIPAPLWHIKVYLTGNRTGSWLIHCVRVAACYDINLGQHWLRQCLVAPSYYVNGCWIIIKSVLWHSPKRNFTSSASELNPKHIFKGYSFKFTITSPRCKWVNLYSGVIQKAPKDYIYTCPGILNCFTADNINHVVITSNVNTEYPVIIGWIVCPGKLHTWMFQSKAAP